MKPYHQGSTLTDNILQNEVRAFNENKLKELSIYNEGLEICYNILKTQTTKADRGASCSKSSFFNGNINFISY